MAICSGSVSPSRSTSTGAFKLGKAPELASTDPSSFNMPRKQLPAVVVRRTHGAHATYLICRALVPSILAFSYFVMYGVVVRWSFGIFLSLCDFVSFP